MTYTIERDVSLRGYEVLEYDEKGDTKIIALGVVKEGEDFERVKLYKVILPDRMLAALDKVRIDMRAPIPQVLNKALLSLLIDYDTYKSGLGDILLDNYIAKAITGIMVALDSQGHHCGEKEITKQEEIREGFKRCVNDWILISHTDPMVSLNMERGFYSNEMLKYLHSQGVVISNGGTCVIGDLSVEPLIGE